MIPVDIFVTATLVFDLDGTLLDSLADIAAAANRMLDDVGHPPLEQNTIRQFVGNGLPKLVERVIHHCGLPLEQHSDLTQSTLAHYNAASSVHTVAYPGTIQALHALSEMGCAMGVCTNKPERPARHILEAQGMSGFFDAVFGGDTLNIRKPNPAHLNACFEALPDTGPRLFVGDSEVDAETARHAQVPFLLFTNGYRKSAISDIHHDVVYNDALELPALVARLATGQAGDL